MAMVEHAVEVRASDIHVEPFEHKLRVRYRVDGMLQEVESPPALRAEVSLLGERNTAHRAPAGVNDVEQRFEWFHYHLPNIIPA